MRWFLVVIQINSTFDVTNIKPIFSFSNQTNCTQAINTMTIQTNVNTSNLACINADNYIPSP